MKLKLNKNFLNELHLSIYKALWDSYVSKIIDNTPYDTGLTAIQWDFYPVSPFKYRLSNNNGEVVLFLEKGTGIYGPLKKRIVPKVKKALRWYDTKSKIWRFAKSTKGMKPRHFVDAVLNDPAVKNLYYEKLQYHMSKINQGK